MRELREQERAAVEAANSAAEAAGRQVSNYKKPRLAYYSIPPNGMWSVFYVSKARSPSRAADCFWITVDAKTSATKFVPHKS